MRASEPSAPAGILLVDKPEGPSSFQVIAKLRRILRTRAIGHAGTLDPLATGLLVVLVGNYTRLSQYLTAADKRYEARVTFGLRTSTDDREGEPLESASPDGLDIDFLRDQLKLMHGMQEQTPPAYSAISVNGERLYAKARRGEQVEVPSRQVMIHELRWLGFALPHLDLDIACSKGTYIRAIARDLGVRVGVPAHLGALRRTQSGAYDLRNGVSLADLESAENPRSYLRVGPEAIMGMPVVPVSQTQVTALEHGQTIEYEPQFQAIGGEDEVAVATYDNTLVAIVQRSGKRIRSLRALGRC